MGMLLQSPGVSLKLEFSLWELDSLNRKLKVVIYMVMINLDFYIF